MDICVLGLKTREQHSVSERVKCMYRNTSRVTVPRTLDGNLISFSCKAKGDVFHEGSDITMAHFTFHHPGNSTSLTLLVVE